MPLEELQEILRVGESVSLTKHSAVAIYSFRSTMWHRIGRGRQSSAYPPISETLAQEAAYSLTAARMRPTDRHLSA